MRRRPAKLAVLFATLCVGILSGLGAPFQPLTLQSRSGQFIVAGVPMPARADPASIMIGGVALAGRSYAVSTSSVTFVRLDPALVAVSCEEIKQALLKELGAADEWKGSVGIAIHPVREDDEPIIITSLHYPSGWNYHLETADHVDRARFLRALVQVLLSEMANREAGSRSAELPPWLANGFAEHLQATSLAGLMLEPQTGVSRRQHASDPLVKVRERLRNQPPLTLDELDWPAENVANADQEAAYQSCAHLLVYELLRLKNGRSCLLQMIRNLHANLNWQTGFFRAFGLYFPRLVDLDKWWTLRVVQFTHGEAFSLLRPDEQWRQLDDALAIPASAHQQTNELPTNTRLSFQKVILDWPFADQQALLWQKVHQLGSVELRAHAEAVQLIEAYRAALQSYLQQRESGKKDSGRKNEAPLNIRSLVRQTIKSLNELDFRREQIKAATKSTALPVQNDRPAFR